MKDFLVPGTKVCPIPGFPVKLVGANEPHAVFFMENRTGGCWLEHLAGNPGYLVPYEMWETQMLV
jgi:hypothetical protein